MEVKQAKQIMNFSHFDTDFLFHDTMGKKGRRAKACKHMSRAIGFWFSVSRPL